MEHDRNIEQQVPDGILRGINFSILSETDAAKLSAKVIGAVNEVTDPALGFPNPIFQCTTCGANDGKKCEGHFGLVNFPYTILNPYFVSEVAQILKKICPGCKSVRRDKVKVSDRTSACKYCDGVLRGYPPTKFKVSPKDMFGRTAIIAEVNENLLKKVQKTTGVSLASDYWDFIPYDAQQEASVNSSNYKRVLSHAQVYSILKDIDPGFLEGLLRRKNSIFLKFSGSDTVHLLGTSVRVRQQQNSFPFGSCICRTNMDNEDFNDFFVKNFNWAVFGNELKWYSTEAQRGKFNYRDADELLDFCTRHNIQVRGHCIFWEVESTVQEWIRSLKNNDLMEALQNRLSGLLTRYRGKFKHYDVNNEMMHGSYYQERLGKDIWANMFKKAHQLDPSAILFVNDYHVEDGCDTRSSPEKYIEHILDLQDQGAPVGGIGIQGHIDCPVGPIVCSALDKLSILGLPIWFTEVDVSSDNEHVRADDLEVMLRESFAHPAVEGVVLWGFWELFMSRENAHLVNAEGELNEAGKRYLALKQEWLSHAHGHIDDQGQFRFRGFHGSYEVDFVTASKKITKTFVVDKGDDALVISIDI